MGIQFVCFMTCFFLYLGRCNFLEIISIFDGNINGLTIDFKVTSMKHTFLLLMLLVFSSLLFVACEDANENDGLKVDELLPVKLGNSWTYKETHYHYYYGGEPEITVDTFNKSISGPYRINGVDYYAMDDSKEIQSPDYFRYLFGSDENGNMMAYGGISNTDTLIFNSVYLKKNATAGEVWRTTELGLNYSDRTFKEDSCTLKCISPDTLITTPKGTFHCMAWNVYDDEEDFTIAFLGFNIGIVKVESYESDRLRSVWELIDCTLH
jgi:hypothetical protein